MSSSGRFFVMSFFNMYICGQAKKRLSKDGKKITFKKYAKFFIFFALLLTINQTVFFFFEPPNLYDEIQISRSMSATQIKQHQKNLEVKIMTQNHIPLKNRLQMVQKIEPIVKILTHPATRLMYDSFGITDTEYAWGFKSQNFLLQMIIQSAIFYFICIFMNMMGKSRDEMKQALKIEMMIIFLVFIWEVELIMKTQRRFHQTTDWIDNIYAALPIFERRQLMKLLLFPITNVCHFFIKFYIPNQSEKKLLKVGTHPKLRSITAKIREHCAKKVKNDQHVEDRVHVAVEEMKSEQPLHSDIYLLQRQVVRGIFMSENQNILVDSQVFGLLSQFHILDQSKQQQFQKSLNIQSDGRKEQQKID